MHCPKKDIKRLLPSPILPLSRLSTASIPWNLSASSSLIHTSIRHENIFVAESQELCVRFTMSEVNLVIGSG